MQGITTYLAPNTTTTIRPNTPDHPQSLIGWNLFLRGFISTRWSTLQNQRHPLELSRHVWASKLIAFLWVEAHELWITRNAFVHSAATAGAPSRAHQTAAADVTQLYNLEQHCDIPNRAMFQVPLATHLTDSTQALRAWAKSRRSAIRSAVRQAQTRLKLQTRDIRSFWPLPPTSSTLADPLAPLGSWTSMLSTEGDQNHPS